MDIGDGESGKADQRISGAFRSIEGLVGTVPREDPSTTTLHSAGCGSETKNEVESGAWDVRDC